MVCPSVTQRPGRGSGPECFSSSVRAARERGPECFHASSVRAAGAARNASIRASGPRRAPPCQAPVSFLCSFLSFLFLFNAKC